MIATVCLAHGPSAGDFAYELSTFLEFGCGAICSASTGGFYELAEHGLSFDAMVLLLSEEFAPPRSERARWEPLLCDETARYGVRVALVQTGECAVPELLRRRMFFADARANPLAAMRALKRWLLHKDLRPRTGSPELEEIYRTVADRAGTVRLPSSVAQRFAAEAAHEFEAVLWIAAHGRTLAQAAGDAGAQLGLVLEGEAEENARRVRDFLAARRFLMVLDAPPADVEEALIAEGRTSSIVTLDPVRPEPVEHSRAALQALLNARRFAEAYEMAIGLRERNIAREACARDLIWILEYWGRTEEANALRGDSGAGPHTQMSLF